MLDQQKNKFIPYTLCIVKDLGSDPEFSGRLAQMGILPGCQVKILRNAPLGDPVELRTEEGQAVALRKEDLEKLDCQVMAAPLTTVPENLKGPFEVVDMAGGWVFVEKMEERGIKKGSILTIIDRFPIRVIVKQTGQAALLGQGEASKLIIKTNTDPAG